MLESLRDIRLFVAVYEELSFTAAAAREHLTQSGVSQHIRKLEDNFGVKLFTRESGRVLPTPAGDSYYTGCIDLLRKHEAVQRGVRQFGPSLEGEIAVGLMPTVTRSALAPALASYTRTHPNVRVRIIEAFSGILTTQTLSGELAFSIVPGPVSTAGLKTRLFLRTPEVLVSNRLSGRKHLAPVRPEELGPVKIVLPTKQNIRRHRIENYLAFNNIEVERVLELDSMFGTLDFISRTDWVAILPAMMMVCDMERSDFTINLLSEPALDLDLDVIEPSRVLMSAAASAFLDTLHVETMQLNDRIGALVAAKLNAKRSRRR